MKMTSTKSEFHFHILVFLWAICFIALGQGRRDENRLLSRLYEQAVENNEPLVLVLDSDKQNRNSQEDSSSSESDLLSLLKLLGPSEKKNVVHKRKDEMKDRDMDFWNNRNYQKNQKRLRAQKTRDRELNDNRDFRLEKEHRHRVRYQDENDSDDMTFVPHSKKHQHRNSFDKRQRNQNRIMGDRKIRNKNVLRSPIMKSLLTLRNSLACGARDQCQDECGGNKQKRNDCENKCEKKFDCEEEKEDPCEDGCESKEPSCGKEDECSGSTKGEMFEDEPGPCPKCN